MKSYFLQVKEVIQETPDTITIQFWHPINEQVKYKAGQFITITVPDKDKKKIKRSYSMCSSPSFDTAVAVSVKRVKDGVVSNYLNDNVKIGDFLEVVEPMGTFFFEPSETPTDRNVVLVGAGSGITPLISIAKTALKSEPNTKVFLLYGNKDEENIIFYKQLRQLCDTYPGRFEMVHVLSKANNNWLGLKGRISQASATMIFKDWGVDFKKDLFYMCGPEGLMQEVNKTLELFDTPSENIHSEKFHATSILDELNEAEASELKIQIVKVIYDGETHDIAVAPHQTILEAALEKDIDLPYSCQAGMCTACMGKCTSGKVLMDEEDGLTESEIKEGYILTCVAHPMSEGVVLEIE